MRQFYQYPKEILDNESFSRGENYDKALKHFPMLTAGMRLKNNGLDVFKSFNVFNHTICIFAGLLNDQLQTLTNETIMFLKIYLQLFNTWIKFGKTIVILPLTTTKRYWTYHVSLLENHSPTTWRTIENFLFESFTHSISLKHTQFVLHDSIISCNVRLMDHFKSLSVN